MALTKVKGHIIADDLALGGNPTTSTQSASDNTTKIATTAYVTTAIANLADSAPSTLNTLNELAAALGDDANFSTTVTNSIAAKLPLAGGTLTGDLRVGTADAASRTITVSGGATGNNEGGEIRLEMAADHDGTYEFWRLDANQDDFRIGRQGQTDLLVDSTGKVAIGVASPDTQLHVNGTIPIRVGPTSGTFADFKPAQLFTSAAYHFASGNNSFFHFSNSSNAAQVSMDMANTRVGIGTSIPATSLHIDQPSNNQAGGLYLERNGSAYGLSLFVDSGGYGIIGGNGDFTPSSIRLDFSNDRVGIGVNPAYGLHVGDGKGFMVGPDNSHGTYISHTHENTINGGYGLDNDTGDIWINYLGYQNGTSRFRDFRVGNGKQNAIIHVDGSSGNIGIGTDPAGIAAPSGILHLYRNSTMDVNLVGNPPELNFEDLGGTSGQKRSRLTGDGNKLSIQGLSDDDNSVTHHFVDFRLDNGGIQFYGDFPDGNQNVCFGKSAGGALNSTGNRNVLLGSRAGMGVTTGDHNVFVGSGTSGSIRGPGEVTDTGVENVGIGTGALGDNTSGSYNTSVGHMSMYYNDSSGSNIAIGVNSMLSGGGAGSNIAIGINSLKNLGNDNNGDSNTAIGFEALEDVTNGDHNIGIGYRAGMNINTGSQNVVIGNNSLPAVTSADRNIAIGYGVMTGSATGSGNIVMGYDAGSNLTSGAMNVIFNHSGHDGGIDVRSKHNAVIIADGNSRPAFHNYVHEDNPYGHIDVTRNGTSENYITCGGGATIPLFSGGNAFSGLFIINDFTRTGDVYFCMTGGGSISIIKQTGSVLQTTSSPSSLQYGIYLSNLGVMFKNGTGTSFNFRLIAFRTRAAQ